MTSVRKKTSSEIFRTPRWLRNTPKSLRSIINPEEVSIYRRMRKAIIQELRPKTPIEWILVNEFVNAQFSAPAAAIPGQLQPNLGRRNIQPELGTLGLLDPNAEAAPDEPLTSASTVSCEFDR